MLVIIFAGALFGSVSLSYPFGRDQGIYAYAGKMLLLGKADYKFVFDVKPPGVHYLFGFEQFILGESMLNMRIFDILWQIATAFVLVIISSRLTKSLKASVICGILYLFLYYRLDYWHTLQADGFLNLPFALSILFLLKTEGKLQVWKYFISGLFFAVVLIFKYTLIIYLPFAVIAVLFISGESIKRKIISLISFSLGMIFVMSAVYVFYYINDALVQFNDIMFKQIPLYANIGYDTELEGFVRNNITRLFFGSVYSPLIFFSLISLVYFAVKKKMNFNKFLVYLWAAAAVISLIVQWKFFYYHFLVIIPPLALGASLLFEILLRYRIKVIAYTSVLVIIVLYFAFGAKPYAGNYETLLNLVSSKQTLSEAYIKNGYTTDSVFMIAKTFRAIECVDNNTNPSDKIYVWGFDPLVYYLSRRLSSSRFIYNFPVYWKGNNDDFRKEFMFDMNYNTPKMILVAQKDPLPFISGYNEDSKQMIERFPEFKLFLEQRYNFKQQVDDFFIYELKRNEQ